MNSLYKYMYVYMYINICVFYMYKYIRIDGQVLLNNTAYCAFISFFSILHSLYVLAEIWL